MSAVAPTQLPSARRELAEQLLPTGERRAEVDLILVNHATSP